jgi:hypothetical protein
MIGDTPTYMNVVGFHMDGAEIQCEELATHAVANVQNGVVIYRCDKHRKNPRCDEFIPYCIPVTLEEAVLIEVFGE